MVLQDNKGRSLFLPDEFHERLISYRKDAYKYKRTIIVTEEFLKEYDLLSVGLKEKAIVILPLIYNAKIPDMYTTVYNDDGHAVIDIAGLEIICNYDPTFPSMSLFHIQASKTPTNMITLGDNDGFGRMYPEGIKQVEDLFLISDMKTHGFKSVYEMEQYRQDNNMKDIREVLKSKGWK